MMQLSHFVESLEQGVVEQLIPLGDSIFGALVTLATAAITYAVGKSKNKAEIANLQAEKKSIEAAAGVSTAEAAQVISEAAASTVQPLIARIKEQQKDIQFLTERSVLYREELELMRTHAAKLAAENELMRTKLKLQGEMPPELLPPEVK